MRCTTKPIRTDVDLNDIASSNGFLFVRSGVGFAGSGVAKICTGEDIKDALDSMDVDNRVGGPGTGPLAFGAIPFNRDEQASFVIPKFLVGKREDGSAFVTTIDDTDDTVEASPLDEQMNNEFTVEDGMVSAEFFKKAVEKTREAIKHGDLVKAVIARDLVIKAKNPINIHGVLLRMKHAFGSSYRYSLMGLVGASPELLVEVLDGVVRSHPLAGTAPRTGNTEDDERIANELLRSEKNQREHRVVIDMVRDTLLPYCSYLDWEAEPSIVEVANVQHLGSIAEGLLTKPYTNVLDLALELCPTPALGGFPRDKALSLIAAVEGLNRGRYGGSVGWLDAHGNGTWAVTIRCAEFTHDRLTARLFAGCGIVADSDPESELAETNAKFRAMLSAIIPT